MLLTALWHQDLRKENHGISTVLCQRLCIPSGGDKQSSDMPEHESVIHRIQSIHYQKLFLRIKKGQRMNNTKKSLKCSLLGNPGIFI